MTLQINKNISLRNFRSGDEESICLNGNNINIWNNMRDFFPNPYTINDAERWIEISKNNPNIFAICYDDVAIGVISVMPRNDIERLSGELGYWLSESFWGKGIGTKVVSSFVKHIFETSDIIRIDAGVFPDNKASQKVLEKSGFYLECIKKQCYIKNYKVIDCYQYVILKANY